MSKVKQRFSVGLVVGAIVGVVAGLLTAPKSGKETRADIKRKAGEVKDQAVTKAKEVGTKAGKVADDARKTANKLSGEAVGKADEIRKRANNAVEGAKKGFNKDVK